MEPDAHAPDFLNVAGLLSDDERQVQATVARFVDERVLPIIADCFEHERFPVELVPEIAALGLLGPTFKDYGCAGLSNVAYGLIMQELERGDSGLRSFCSVQSGLVMYPIHRYGSAEQKQHWLPRLARAEAIGCFGLTEPDGGSDPGTMKTHARETAGGEWVLNGAKMWITNGSVADIAVVWAKTDGGSRGAKAAGGRGGANAAGGSGAAQTGIGTDGVIRGFLVEKGAPGYTTRDIPHKFSLRASVTSELFFDNCRVPKDAILPAAEGLAAPLSCLTQARYGIAWGAIGAAQACYREALQFARQRVLFGEALSHKQLVQQRLADMVRRITTAQLLAWQLGRLKDLDHMHHTQVSLAKWNNVRMALDVAREARDLLGAGGISAECSPIRHMLNLESVITYEGTEDIHQLIVGRQITGTEAF